jgi:hypothetical protein
MDLDLDLDLNLGLDLDIKMQSLTVNDILYQNTYENTYQDDNYTMYSDESSELTESESTISEHIIYDMQNLSVNEKEEFMYDLFNNNLDIYSIYSDIKENLKAKIDPTEYNTDMKLFYNKYNILRIIGVPNIYCDGENFDDEDFIYNHFKLTEQLSYLVKNDNTVPELYTTQINFKDNIISPENVYYKILYVFQFVHYFHTTLSTLTYKKRIMHLPQEFLFWTDNIVSIIRNTINITDMNTSLCVYQNTNNVNLKNVGKYFKDMVYGLSLCVCHLKMILNHNRVKNIPFWDMETIYIEKFFRVLNNLCIIVIYMKHGF